MVVLAWTAVLHGGLVTYLACIETGDVEHYYFFRPEWALSAGLLVLVATLKSVIPHVPKWKSCARTCISYSIVALVFTIIFDTGICWWAARFVMKYIL